MAEFHDKDVSIEERSMLNEVYKIRMVLYGLMDFDFVEEKFFLCFWFKKVFLNNFEGKLIFYFGEKITWSVFFGFVDGRRKSFS
jgi:hypothetical protein